MIRIRNTRTGRTVTAKNGKDAALMAKIELDRRSGLEARHPATDSAVLAMDMRKSGGHDPSPQAAS